MGVIKRVRRTDAKEKKMKYTERRRERGLAFQDILYMNKQKSSDEN